MPKTFSGKMIAAGIVALLADFLQVLLFPLFFEGGVSPINDALDAGVAVILTSLLGWHWVFLPSALAELVPGLDMAPFWSTAVFYVLFKQKKEVPGAPPAELKRVSGQPLS